MALSLLGLRCANSNGTAQGDPSPALPQIEATVVEIDFHKGQLESAVYPRVHVAFTNNDDDAVQITEYGVKWTDGGKSIEPGELTLASGQRLLVHVIIYPDGTVTRPTLKDTTVEWTAVRLGGGR